jgi:GDP-mannose pyrophosphatase NudK
MPNNRVKILENKVLSDNWYTLRRITFDYQKNDGTWQTHRREAYDRGNGAAILLYNKAQKTVILVKQFRVPTYLNKNDDGMLLEACAGVLDNLNPKECIIKEVKEETGYIITDATKVLEAYTSPGAVTEMLHLFIAEYTPDQKVDDGGGVFEEEEDLEVIEMPFDAAYALVESGEMKDAKTIMLLQYAKIHNLLGY